jgi:hypothetical protein
MDYPQYLEIEADIGALHTAYVKYKHEHNLMDYDDLLLDRKSTRLNSSHRV